MSEGMDGGAVRDAEARAVEAEELAAEAAERRHFEATRLPRHVRSCAGVAFTINTAFMVLDAFAYPEHLGLFAAIRLALNALFVLIWRYGAEHAPKLSEWAIGLSLGAAMLSMVYATGGPTSGYFVGLILVLVGIGVLLPLSGREAAVLGMSFVIPYAMTPLFSEAPLDVRDFGIRLVFVISGALECVWSCTFLDSLRLQDFRMRREIEQARDHLKQMDAVKSRFTANMHHELRTPLTL
ncbi:MAG: hypothetical protein QNK05_19085, partial [Myxococcota bacterium]|nr:hypothetical protein [Myxococcota bacterium]